MPPGSTHYVARPGRSRRIASMHTPGVTSTARTRSIILPPSRDQRSSQPAGDWPVRNDAPDAPRRLRPPPPPACPDAASQSLLGCSRSSRPSSAHAAAVRGANDNDTHRTPRRRCGTCVGPEASASLRSWPLKLRPGRSTEWALVRDGWPGDRDDAGEAVQVGEVGRVSRIQR